jgi:hypothetical protein
MINKRQPRNYRLFSTLRNRAFRSLNNIYVLDQLATRALLSEKKELESGRKTKLNFEVPSIKGDFIETARKKEDIIQLLEEALENGLARNSLISAVAIIESYLADVLRCVLLAFPEKINKKDKKVDFALILDVGDLNALLLRIIDREIYSVFFLAPERYFDYVENILSINIPQSAKDCYTEIKATRDLLVHNDGIINETYLRKAGKQARGGLGQRIPVDEMYIDQAFGIMKKLVKTLYSESVRKFGSSERFPL